MKRRTRIAPAGTLKVRKDDVQTTCPFCGAVCVLRSDGTAHALPVCEAFDTLPADEVTEAFKLRIGLLGSVKKGEA